jgi:hypothetical protein
MNHGLMAQQAQEDAVLDLDLMSGNKHHHGIDRDGQRVYALCYGPADSGRVGE